MPAESAPSLLEIFSEAAELSSRDERVLYLNRVCGGNILLREQVERLLKAHANASEFLESPVVLPTLDFESECQTSVSPGVTIGRYKILEEIGEGGMGVVYMAEQTEPVRRRVALKVIRPGMDTRQFIARFEAERQALALMDHPNIARVIDASATETGRPYFVMELVPGLPITEYCDREQLSIKERLEIFVLVCRAVQHAHQKGIIHRDLKPSNILVTLVDGVAIPKVIDFGVSKALAGRLTEHSLHTRFHQFLGTPLYVSPEQTDLAGMDVDTRSDIYSLGVLLYELLTGTTPFEPETLRQATFDEMRRIIREENPPKPSKRLCTLRAEQATISVNRKVDLRRLNHCVRGELDWIVMKALEKDRNRRYETANGLATDLIRHLANRPVEACPPSSWYRLNTFARRNRLMLSAVTLSVAGLLTGTAISVWQAIRATRSAEESKQVVQYLVKDVLGAASRDNSPGHELTMFEVLRTADRTIGDRFRDHPAVEASIRLTLAKVYEDLARDKEALAQNERAFDLRQSCLGPEHPETLEAANELVFRLKSNRKSDEAIELGRWVLATREQVLGQHHPDSIYAEARLAVVLNKPEHREEAFQRANRAARNASRHLGPDHYVTIAAQEVVGTLHFSRGEFEEAIVVHRDSLQGHERVLGPLHTESLWAIYHLAQALERGGHFREARVTRIETVHRFARASGVGHRETIFQLECANRLLRAEGNYAGVRDLSQDLLGRILATPFDRDPWSRQQRRLVLSVVVLELAALPETIRFDGALALRAANEAVALDDTWADGHAVLGLVHHRMGQDDRAWDVLSTAMNRFPTDEASHLNRLVQAYIHARSGRTEQANDLYDELGEWRERDKGTWELNIHAFRCRVAEILNRPLPRNRLPRAQPSPGGPR